MTDYLRSTRKGKSQTNGAYQQIGFPPRFHLFFLSLTTMEDRIQFNINESLKYYLSDPASIPTPDADPELSLIHI